MCSVAIGTPTPWRREAKQGPSEGWALGPDRLIQTLWGLYNLVKSLPLSVSPFLSLCLLCGLARIKDCYSEEVLPVAAPVCLMVHTCSDPDCG